MNNPLSSPAAAPQKRIVQLDLLRAVAVLLVVGNHMTVCPPETNFYFNKFTSFWNRGGWVGVDLFFVLSGFLVSGLLFREYKKTGDLDIKRFLIRRGFKIYPSFWVLLAATCFAALFVDVHFSRSGLVGEFFFVQNYAPHFWEHTWTLAVEEHFYIALCILFFALLKFKNAAKNPFAAVPKIFVFLTAVCLMLRLLTAYFLPFGYERNIEPTHLRLDSLFFGVFISYLWHFKDFSENEFVKRHKFSIGLAGVALLLPAFLFDFNDTHVWLATVGLSMFYLGGGMLLVFALKTDFSKLPFAAFFAYAGTFSYSIYLWNAPVQYFLSKTIRVSETDGSGRWFLYAAVYLTATFVVGVSMSKLIEYPLLKIRNKYFPMRAAD